MQGKRSIRQSSEPTVSTRLEPAAIATGFSKLHSGVVTDGTDVVLVVSAFLLDDD